MKQLIKTTVLILLFFAAAKPLSAQFVKIGPRLTGNFNIYDQDGLTGSYNGLGIGIGGVVDLSFSQNIGMLINLTVFDMKNFSNSRTVQTTTIEESLTLSYITFDPLFKAEFSGFYLAGGPSLGIKLNSSGETSTVVTGQAPNIQPLNLDTESLKFDLAFGTGYNFKLAPKLFLGSDFMVYIPLTNTYNTPGISNSVLTLKLGVSVKFGL